MAKRQCSLESVAGLSREFWRGRRVFVTGHTGFKGAWLSLWLADMGASVTGYALQPSTQPNLFELACLSQRMASIIGDVRDDASLHEAIRQAKPEIVIHLAAQPLVLESYRNPVETYAVNIMGTVNLLEAVRLCGSVKAVVNVTSDKCYDNREWDRGYRENDRLGGSDPYSSSKACSELVASAYRKSFFNPADGEKRRAALATARAGNVIGGGDWAADRLLADCVRSLLSSEPIKIRNPYSTRPWQHVLEPLRGYLLLARKLFEAGPAFAESWNFGPAESDAKQVEWVARQLIKEWGNDARYEVLTEGQHMPEAKSLRLNCAKARNRLGWSPCWTLEHAVTELVEWTRAFQKGQDMCQFTLGQIHKYEFSVAEKL